MGNTSSTMKLEHELTRHPAITKPRYENILDDIRLYDGTREALRAIAGAVEYPSPSKTTKSEWEEWWKKMGPVFADVMAGWVQETSQSIQDAVSKTDLVHQEVPIRILQSKQLVKSKNNHKVPVIVYLHGGGFTDWSFQDKTYDGYLTRLAALGTCIVVAVDYRPAHSHPFPTCLDDCSNITKWVAQGGAASHGVPAGKVLLAGDSSGSNLAFGTALQYKREGILNDIIAGLYYLCPYFAGETKTKDYPSMMECDGLFASEGFLDAVVGNVCDDKTKAKWFASPLLWPIMATKEDMEGMPPSSTIVMQLDMIRDMGVEMHYKLKQAGVESYLNMASGGVHEQQLFSKHSPYVTQQSIHDLTAFAAYCCGK